MSADLAARQILDELASLKTRLARVEAVAAALPAFGPCATRMIEIISVTAEVFGMTPVDITSARRDGAVMPARWAAMWVARHTLPYSLPMIGRALTRDHTTVIHGLRRADRLRARDPQFRERTDAMLRRFEAEDRAALQAQLHLEVAA